jgi:addiction module HigA family antidote
MRELSEQLRPPTAPGDVLRQEFLEAHDITQDRLAVAMGVSRFRVNEIINGRRAVTPETALLLGAALGTTAEFWLNLQRALDLHESRQELRARLGKVQRLIPEKSESEWLFELPDE